MTNRKFRLGTTLMVTASSLSLAAPALATEIVFSTSGNTELRIGERMSQAKGLTQVRLDNGAMVSIIDAADYSVNADDSITLHSGNLTVIGGKSATVVRLPGDVQGDVAAGATGSFTATQGGARGHAMSGTVRIGRAGDMRGFGRGEMFAVNDAGKVRQVVSNGAQVTPDGSLADAVPVMAMTEGGPAAAAVNGLPVTLGEALASAGASSDIVEAARRVDAAGANPSIETYPVGDLGLLVANAAGLANAYGGTPFTGAQADIVRTYLTYLANGGSSANFLTAYAGLLGDYLDLIRSGAAPSGFGGASVAEIDSFVTFAARTGRLGAFTGEDRVLIDAYLAFILDGGNADLFAGRFADLTTAYFAFVRAGGDPAAFEGASQETLASYIAFLAESGLSAQLSAQNQALLAAYLANGGLAFTAQYQSALAAFATYLAGGGLPSDYTALTPAQQRTYLETLQATGLLSLVAGGQADFYAAYIAYLQGGGAIDGFAGLPANIYAGYAVQLDAYYAYLAAGFLPSGYDAADLDALAAAVAQLQAAGVLNRYLGEQADFFAAYNAFLAGGGDVDSFAQLNANIFAGYATQLDAYFAFLAGGGLPSDYAAGDPAVLAAYLAALDEAGALERFLGAQADFYAGYLAFVESGGAIDAYAALNANIFAGYATQLAAYYAYLENGGVPSAYAALDQATIAAYVAALQSVGASADFLEELAQFYIDYAAYLGTGGNPDLFAGLPVPLDAAAFASALNAYADFLVAGGLPTDYDAAALDLLATYAARLVGAGEFAERLGANADLVSAYFAYLASGGAPDLFAGLPVYADYVSALNAFYDYLADGGLPAGYAALDGATIEAYLAALEAAGGLDAYASLDGFFADYYAFLATGGDPAEFAGLPIYGDYVAALNAYFAYLAGGGLPADYDAVDLATLTDYLEALDAAGGLDAYASLAAFFTDYYAFLVAGGDPTSYDGLPAFDGYVAALNAYAAFLAGGGLPGAYDALDAATIQAYLEALAAAGGLASYDDLDSFFADYYAYLVGGGDPADYAGLPAYADYLDAIEAYYAYLAGGGAPSGYTALTEAEVEAYLARLADLGLLADRFSGDVLAFLNDYLAFLAGGGVGDDFAGLPGGGNGGSNYAGGFDGTGITIIGQGSGSRDGNATQFDLLRQGSNAYEAVLDDDGGLLAYRFERDNLDFYRRGTAKAVDIAGDENVLIGRWTDGTVITQSSVPASPITSLIGPNQGFHYMLSTGYSEPALFPEGRVYYDLAHATAPTIDDGSLVPGVFDARAAIIFGATPKMAFESTLTFGSLVGTFATEGGVDGDGTAFFISAPNRNTFGGYFGFNVGGNWSDGREGTLYANGQIADREGNQFGLSYAAGANDAAYQDTNTFYGAAIFEKSSDQPGGGTGGGTDGGTGGGTGGGGIDNPTTDFTGTRPNSIFFMHTDGLVVTAQPGTIEMENGGITGFSAISGTWRKGSASVAEAGDNGTIAWARWAGGTVEQRSPFIGNRDFPIGANGGYHVYGGTPTAVLPTSGTVRYEQIGGTSATDDQGSAPGTLTGDLSIAFGSTARVGYDLAMEVGGKGWAVSTTGGADDPTQSEVTIGGGPQNFTFGGAFGKDKVTASGGACAGDCYVNVLGSLYGANGEFVGLAMDVNDDGASLVKATGLAIFAATGGTGGTAPGLDLAAPAPVRLDPLMVAPGWDRWVDTGAGAFDPRRELAPAGRLDVATGLPAGADGAEAMLGDWIRFEARR